MALSRSTVLPLAASFRRSQAYGPLFLTLRDIGRRCLHRGVSPRVAFSSLPGSTVETAGHGLGRLVSQKAGCQLPSHNVIRQFYAERRNQRPVSTVGNLSGTTGGNTEQQDVVPALQPDGETDIKIVDYSADCIVKHDLSRSSLDDFLKNPKKPDWASCRWIYVNGIDLEVVRRLGLNNNLHRLAIEDVMHPNTPTKVDWYNNHCFIVLTLQRLVSPQQPGHQNRADKMPTSTPRARFLDDLHGSSQSKTAKEWSKHLTHKHKVSVEQVSIFLTNDTVITIFDRSGQEVFEPIFTRLESPQTMIRSSDDASMLAQAVCDSIVDLALPVGKAFGDAFHELELAVLTSPTIAQSKQLYALRSELTLFQDVIAPISSLVRMLRDHHAVAPPSLPAKNFAGHGPVAQQSTANDLISPMTRTYLADVQDRIVVLSSSVGASIRSAEHLTSLMFSTITAKQNESVRQLTLVSIFFLPLTFLTGYFGMNFDPMPVVNDNSDVLFWYIATPVMLASMLFMTSRAAWSRSASWLRQRRARVTEKRKTRRA